MVNSSLIISVGRSSVKYVNLIVVKYIILTVVNHTPIMRIERYNNGQNLYY